jgi:penicillin amidase
VISDLDNAGSNQPLLAVAMGNLAPGDIAAAGLLALNRATDLAEAGLASGRITAPVQNLLVADRSGIAQFVTGRIPVRRNPDGRMPVAGADGLHDWIGMASGAQLPRTVNPVAGRLVNGNERIAPPNFPVFLGSDWFGDWRARRIHQMLDATDRHEVEGFARMQVDTHSAFAVQILPALLAAGAPAGPASQALDLLRGWDGSMAMDRPQPLIFNQWLDRFYGRVLAQAGIPPGYGGPQAETVAFVLSPAGGHGSGAHWCGGDCSALVRDALVAAVDELRQAHGPDPLAWRWGDAHQAVFAHPILRGIPVLGWLTTIRVPVAGDDSTVDRQGGRGPNFDSVHGAGYRGVYDLADLDRSRFVIAPGQSGHPLSRHAGDFISRWRDGGTVTLGPLPDRVTGTIRLTP